MLRERRMQGLRWVLFHALAGGKRNEKEHDGSERDPRENLPLTGRLFLLDHVILSGTVMPGELFPPSMSVFRARRRLHSRLYTKGTRRKHEGRQPRLMTLGSRPGFQFPTSGFTRDT